MFAPLKVWRKWQRKVNLNQKRNAVCSALAAAACAPLVQARGHRIDSVPELPLVVNSLNGETTKALLENLNKVGAQDDLTRVRRSKRTRAGIGKMKNSRFTFRKGPLIIYGDDDSNLKRTSRNLGGVEICHVSRINLLQLAPGGHLGRFIIFTKDAFAKLDGLYGSATEKSCKKGFTQQRSLMACADLARIINSDQVQSKLRDQRTSVRAHDKTKKNPLTNASIRNRLNPFAATQKKLQAASEAKRHTARQAALKAKTTKAEKAAFKKRTGTYQDLQKGLKDSFKHAEDVIAEEQRQGNYVPGETSEEDDE